MANIKAELQAALAQDRRVLETDTGTWFYMWHDVTGLALINQPKAALRWVFVPKNQP